jgi:hypothetical protein
MDVSDFEYYCAPSASALKRVHHDPDDLALGSSQRLSHSVLVDAKHKKSDS